MENIGAILGWKFDHAPGMTTFDGAITEWPQGLGPLPTSQQLLTWEAEYEQAMADAAAQPGPSAQRLVRMNELLAIPRTAWTAAQLRELLEFTALEVAS